MNKEITTTVPQALGALFIRIFKEDNLLEIWYQNEGKFQLFKTFPICKWSGSLGPKLREGDGQSPEGFYTITKNLLKPDSKFYRAANIGFPNEFDKANDRTGSFIMIHGGCQSIGCYAMTDEGIHEIYNLWLGAFENNQATIPVHIFPFKLTTANLSKFKTNPNFDFWMNLKEAYDFFEERKKIPQIGVKDKQYTFSP
jgi:murein L,D-transpeptidase YafK